MPLSPLSNLNHTMTTNHTSLLNNTQHASFNGAGISLLGNTSTLPAIYTPLAPLSNQTQHNSTIVKILADYNQQKSQQAPTTTTAPSTRAQRRELRTPLPNLQGAAPKLKEPKLKEPKSKEPTLKTEQPLQKPSQAPEQTKQTLYENKNDDADPSKTNPDNTDHPLNLFKLKTDQADEQEPIEEQNKPKRRVRRVANGDQPQKGSLLHHTIGDLHLGGTRTECTASLIGKNQFITAAHCVSKHVNRCEKPENFYKATIYVRNRSYQCTSYSIPHDCVQILPTQEKTKASNRLNTNHKSSTGLDKIPKTTPERRDVVICNTNRPVTNGRILPLMSSEDYKTFLTAAASQNVNPKPNALFIGVGRTGKECNGPVTATSRLSWNQFQGFSIQNNLNSKDLLFVPYKTFQRETNYGPCGGDSGGPMLYFNNKTNTYELVGVLTAGGSEALQIAEIASSNYTTWLTSNNIKPWSENSDSSLSYYNVTQDEKIRIPLVPAFKGVRGNTATDYELERPTGNLKDFLKVNIQNELKTEGTRHYNGAIYTTQNLQYFHDLQNFINGDAETNFNISDTVRTKIYPDGELDWTYYPYMRLDGLNLASKKYSCDFKWNTTTLQKLIDRQLSLNKIDLEQSDKKMYSVNINVRGDYLSNNITVETTPPDLLTHNQNHCKNHTLNPKAHYYFSAAEPSTSPWTTAIAISTAVSFLLKDG